MKTLKQILALVLALTCCLLCCTSCSGSGGHGDARTYTYDEAVEELESKLTKVTTTQVEAPLDIYDLETVTRALADIDTFDLTVRGTGQIDIEIAAPSELSGETPDDLINILAKNFNNSRPEINGQTASVSVRKIASGEVLTYMTEGDYRPDVYIPSSDALGKMLQAKGVDVIELTKRMAGNTAGILMEKQTHEDFVAKYGDVSVDKVLEASLAGDLTFAYTNPYTSATGLNILTTMLHSFDPRNPLSEAAAQKLLDYQRQTPPVAYTTGVLRTQAAKGIIKAMVMEEQAYHNSPELRDYVYIPAGIRHDHPVYTFGYVSEERQAIARMFVDYCLSAEAQKLADSKGFNLHNDYRSQDPGLDGAGYLAAQKLWKTNKDGGRPIVAIFVADISGSMDGAPLTALKESLTTAASYIGSGNYVGLVSYADEVFVNLELQPFDEEQRARFSGAVKSLAANGGTATYDAVLVALEMLHRKAAEIPNAKTMLFVLSDGEQNRGYSLGKITDIVGGMRVPIYTIGYNLSETNELQILSDINEAALINAETDDIINQLRNLFNVQL